MSKEETQVRAIRMPMSMIEKIEKMAKKDNRNFSNMSVTILIEALKTNKS